MFSCCFKSSNTPSNGKREAGSHIKEDKSPTGHIAEVRPTRIGASLDFTSDKRSRPRSALLSGQQVPNQSSSSSLPSVHVAPSSDIERLQQIVTKIKFKVRADFACLEVLASSSSLSCTVLAMGLGSDMVPVPDPCPYSLSHPSLSAVGRVLVAKSEVLVHANEAEDRESGGQGGLPPRLKALHELVGLTAFLLVPVMNGADIIAVLTLGAQESFAMEAARPDAMMSQVSAWLRGPILEGKLPVAASLCDVLLTSDTLLDALSSTCDVISFIAGEKLEGLGGMVQCGPCILGPQGAAAMLMLQGELAPMMDNSMTFNHNPGAEAPHHPPLTLPVGTASRRRKSWAVVLEGTAAGMLERLASSVGTNAALATFTSITTVGEESAACAPEAHIPRSPRRVPAGGPTSPTGVPAHAESSAAAANMHVLAVLQTESAGSPRSGPYGKGYSALPKSPHDARAHVNVTAAGDAAAGEHHEDKDAPMPPTQRARRRASVTYFMVAGGGFPAAAAAPDAAVEQGPHASGAAQTAAGAAAKHPESAAAALAGVAGNAALGSFTAMSPAGSFLLATSRSVKKDAVKGSEAGQPGGSGGPPPLRRGYTFLSELDDVMAVDTSGTLGQPSMAKLSYLHMEGSFLSRLLASGHDSLTVADCEAPSYHYGELRRASQVHAPVSYQSQLTGDINMRPRLSSAGGSRLGSTSANVVSPSHVRLLGRGDTPKARHEQAEGEQASTGSKGVPPDVTLLQCPRSVVVVMVRDEEGVPLLALYLRLNRQLQQYMLKEVQSSVECVMSLLQPLLASVITEQKAEDWKALQGVLEQLHKGAGSRQQQAA